MKSSFARRHVQPLNIKYLFNLSFMIESVCHVHTALLLFSIQLCNTFEIFAEYLINFNFIPGCRESAGVIT